MKGRSLLVFEQRFSIGFPLEEMAARSWRFCRLLPPVVLNSDGSEAQLFFL
jgi:hypothetical protein